MPVRGWDFIKKKKKKKSEQESIQACVNDKKNVVKKIKQIQVVLISRIDKSYKVVESKIDWYFS